MKPIEAYNIMEGDWICYNSKLCSVAYYLGILNRNSANHDPKLDIRIDELIQSFYNQWQFVITTYDKLYKLLEALNKMPDIYESENPITEYEIEAIEREVEFRNYSYLLIVSMKTYLDLFSCLVDIIQNQEIRNEIDYPSFHSIGNEKYNSIAEIKKEYKSLKSKTKYHWISSLIDARDRVIHRGYHLKPMFWEQKSKELNIQLYKGDNFNKNNIFENIEIGKLFIYFMTDMPLIEERISNILIEKIEIFNKKLPRKVSFRYDKLITQYQYNEIK